MTMNIRRSIRIALLVALIGLFAAVPLIQPGAAVARPYLINDGPTPSSGDPTGDDQPAPAPKPTNKAGMRPQRISTTRHDVVSSRTTWVSAGWILRSLISFWLR
jgi:hypothetical protein